MAREYTASVTFHVEAESMSDAAEQFRHRLVEGGFTVAVTDDATGESGDIYCKY